MTKEAEDDIKDVIKMLKEKLDLDAICVAGLRWGEKGVSRSISGALGGGKSDIFACISIMFGELANSLNEPTEKIVDEYIKIINDVKEELKKDKKDDTRDIIRQLEEL